MIEDSRSLYNQRPGSPCQKMDSVFLPGARMLYREHFSLATRILCVIIFYHKLERE